jgi:hypothetical protein
LAGWILSPKVFGATIRTGYDACQTVRQVVYPDLVAVIPRVIAACGHSAWARRTLPWTQEWLRR